MSGRRVVALDIGSSTVRCAVAEADGGRLRVLGVGTAPSAGLRKGLVVDQEALVPAIMAAVEGAERTSGVLVDTVVLGISGAHVSAFEREAVVSVGGRDGRVTAADVNRVLDGARAVPIPEGQELVHLIPRGYLVDGGSALRDPVGVPGARLEVAAHLVTAGSGPISSLVAATHAAGLQIEDVVVGALAAAEGVIRDVELDRAVAVADVGGGTTDVAVFSGAAICHTAVLPIGGHHVTMDLAAGLHCELAEAEQLKLRYGHCDPSALRADEVVTVHGAAGSGPREVTRRQLVDIIEPRAHELARLIGRELTRAAVAGAPLERLILSGGTVCLEGFPQVLHRILEVPVRVAVPEGLQGLADQLALPGDATAAGLLHWGARSEARRDRSNTRSAGTAGRLNRWFHDMF